MAGACQPELERRGQSRALINGALGIQLGSHIGATDQMHLLPGCFQVGLQYTQYDDGNSGAYDRDNISLTGKYSF